MIRKLFVCRFLDTHTCPGAEYIIYKQIGKSSEILQKWPRFSYKHTNKPGHLKRSKAIKNTMDKQIEICLPIDYQIVIAKYAT